MNDPRLRLEPIAWFAPTDDRRDPWVTVGLPAPLLEHAARTCYLVGVTAIASRRARRVLLHHQTYGAWNSLCGDEPFREQPVVLEREGDLSVGFGYSGYLVSPDTVLTCWHGWENFSRRAQVAVFGYAASADSHISTELPAAQVLPVAAYPETRPPPAIERGSCSGDWVLLRLEHPVTHLGTLAPLHIEAPLRGRAVYTLGHPGGLPLKLADRAKILNVSDGAFSTDLDTFTGNSGSPVFDAESHALVGLVVEGQKGQGDFKPSPARRCYVANRIEGDASGQLSVPSGCFAPDVTR